MNYVVLFASLIIAILGFSSYASAQFEGSIEFRKMTLIDTTKYIYYVQGNQVRIDEIGSRSKKIEGSFLINLKENTMVSLSHERKLYMDQKAGAPVKVTGSPEIKTTGETKTLLGMKCKEMFVSNKAEKTTITYYIGASKCDFFTKMLKVMNRKDKPAVYFLLLKDAGDGFPFLSIQKDDTGKEVGRLEVLKFEKKALDASLFVIPKDYHKFEKN